MGFVINLFYCCLRLLLSSDVEVNPGPIRRCLRKCRVMYCNIRGLHGNLPDLSVASRHSDVLICSETLVSSRRHLSELVVTGFSKHMQILQGQFGRSRGLAVYVRACFQAYRQQKFECGC